MRGVIIMGAGGRDFHDFNIVFRDDPRREVVAFTAAQIPGIDDRRYPPSLAGPLLSRRDPDPARGGARRADPRARRRRGRVRLLRPLACGRDAQGVGRARRRRRLPAARARARRCSGARSPSSRCARSAPAAARARRAAASARSCVDAGLEVALVRHPMPYGDLEACASSGSPRSRTSTPPTRRSRSARSTRRPSRSGWSCTPASTTRAILGQAQAEADVIIWDGGNNDFSFFRPDLLIVVVDPLRAGPRARVPPRRDEPADGRRRRRQQGRQRRPRRGRAGARRHRAVNPRADGRPGRLAGRRSRTARRSSASAVLVVEDGPTITHGGMPFGAGTVAARQRGARRSGRPAAVRRRLDRRDLRALPAHRLGASRDGLLGRAAARARGDDQRDRRATSSSPARRSTSTRLIESRHPIRHVTYELAGDRRAEPRARFSPRSSNRPAHPHATC